MKKEKRNLPGEVDGELLITTKMYRSKTALKFQKCLDTDLLISSYSRIKIAVYQPNNRTNTYEKIGIHIFMKE